jgi:hypothetical protein
MQRILLLTLPLVEDPAELAKLQAETAEVVTFIADHAPSDDLRQRYLASPQVRPLLQLNQSEALESGG